MMERLTFRDEDGDVRFVEICDEKGNQLHISQQHPIWANRLASYEDTGLMPEEIKQDSKVANAVRKAQAEGRLIVLPCKVGDSFYTLEKYCSDGQDDGIKTRHWGSDCDEYCCTYPCDAEIRVAEWKWASPIRILQEQKRIGKDIFLTREEAEAALEAKE